MNFNPVMNNLMFSSFEPNKLIKKEKPKRKIN